MAHYTRSFYLIVSEDLLPFSQEPKKGFNSFKMMDGTYFNTRARLPTSMALRKEYAEQINLKIKDLVMSEARKLQQDWYKGVPQYFNRRSYGMYFRKGGYPSNRRPKRTKGNRRFRRGNKKPHNMNSGPFIGDAKYLWDTQGRSIEAKYTANRRQFPGRNSTGQLRRALAVTDLSSMGCLLFVKPCHAATGRRVDYVAILMRGAGAKANPYVPEIDRRVKVKGGRWRGIKQSYWLRWQHYFMKKVDKANERLHNRIIQMLTQMKVLEQQDLARLHRGSKIKKNISDVEAERKQRTVRYGPVTPDSPYNRARGFNDQGPYKRDPQVYYNKHNKRFNPYINTPRGKF